VVEIGEFHLEGNLVAMLAAVLGLGPLTVEPSSSFLLLLLFRHLVLFLTPPLPAHDRASVQASHFIHSEKVIESTIRSSK